MVHSYCAWTDQVLVPQGIISRTLNPPSLPSTPSTQPLCLNCTLDTKYYTAEVGFWIDSAQNLTEAELEDWKQLSDSVDGFIYVFDRNKVCSIYELKREKCTKFMFKIKSQKHFKTSQNGQTSFPTLIQTFPYASQTTLFHNHHIPQISPRIWALVRIGV